MMLLLLVLCVSVSAISADRPKWHDGECGRSMYEDAGRWPDNVTETMIVGGMESRAHEFPWQVSLRRNVGASGHFCGGNIINSRWVLTAAHCVIGDEDVYAIVGEHDSSDGSNEQRQAHRAEAIFVHEEYALTARYDSDIALVKLIDEIAMTEQVQPVCAPYANDTYAGSAAQISGWGSVKWGGGCCPDVLQWTEVVVTTNEYCDEKVSGVTNNHVTDTMICSSDDGDHFERDTCQGDSGGPMTARNTDGSFEIIGLTSWGYRCAGGTPGVYARVSVFNDWVTAKITKN